MFIVAIVICNYRKSIIRAQYYVIYARSIQKRNSCAITKTEEEYEKK